MDRRQALARVGLILGGTITGAGIFLERCAPAEKKEISLTAYTPEDVAYLDEIAETILPETGTPGAKAAKTGAFMVAMVTDCYDVKNQEIFRSGMHQLNERSMKKSGTGFMESTPQQRQDLLLEIDAEQKEYTKNKKADDPAHYFRLMKELTLTGYFSSEVGAKQALLYVEVPGRYEGCIPYKKGDKAWAL